MKDERWRQIDQLFHHALEQEPAQRAAFLAQSCAGDELLCEEVLSLIESYEQANDFIETPASDVAAELLARASKLEIGQNIGHYMIVASLGAGGMGQVYLAQDTQLERRIALKILPTQFTSDSERVRRFEQEARAASALNHPNIVTIHEIGKENSSHFIATEFVDGETLRQHMMSKRLQLAEALDIAAQISSALSVAHAAGIVHRDIKPENIMLRRDGIVKVVDFGLAKLAPDQVAIQSQAPTRPMVNTNPGVVMGTVGYMSPEQARGADIDARTDIWSLGVVLYEMVSGRAPFVGETPSHIIVSIFEHDPAPLSITSEVPDELQRIVFTALTKNREHRYQKVGDLLTALKRLKQRLEVNAAVEGAAEPREIVDEAGVTKIQQRAVPTEPSETRRPTQSISHLYHNLADHRQPAVIALTILMIVIGGIAIGLYKFTDRNRSAVDFQTMKMSRLTINGRAGPAVISADGKYVAHVLLEAGGQSLWLRQVGTTSDILIAPPTDVDYAGLVFSRDGTYIYFTNSSQGLYRLPAIGGPKSLVMTKVNGPISFSPDSKRFAFVRRYDDESSIVIANADGTAEQKLTSRREAGAFGTNFFGAGPTWSPDGKVIACAAGSADSNGRFMNVVEVRVEDGIEKPITSRRWARVEDLAWLPNNSGLLVLAIDKGSFLPAQIWRLSLLDGEARRIINDFDGYSGLSLTADSRMLVTTQEHEASNIWIAPNGETGRANQITSRAGSYNYVSWTREGKLVYASSASGNWDIWIMGMDGGDGKQLTVDAGANLIPSVSPDGRYIVFTSNRSGSPNIWRIDIDGSNPKQLTSGKWDYGSSCSPDGKWLVYIRESSGKRTLWRVSIDGYGAEQLSDQNALYPAISPDGKLIAFSSSYGKVTIISSEGGRPFKSLDIPRAAHDGPAFLWTPDGRALTYHVTRDGADNIWSQPLDGSPPKQVTDFKSDEIFSFAWSPDGRELALARGGKTSDVVLITNSK